MSPDEFTQADTWAGRPIAHKIADAAPRERVVLTGVVRSTEITSVHGTPSFECRLDDGTGQIGLLFLGRRSVAGIVVGTSCTVEGTARMEGDRLVVWNPLHEVEPDDSRGRAGK